MDKKSIIEPPVWVDPFNGYPFQYFRRNSENNVVVPCNSDRYYELP